MSTSVIPFPSGDKIPAYLKRGSVDASAFTAGVSAGFPYLSIKGKVWTVVRDGERKVVANPKDPDSPATAVQIVLLNANPHLSKVYYKDGYEDGSTEKPTCFSNDGIRPSDESVQKQCKTCAACPHNVWGSGGGGKGKACSDSRRVAVARADALDDPMLLRIPPASLKTLREHAETVARHGIPLNAVITKVSFDPAEATPRLLFTPESMLEEDYFYKAEEVAKSDQVQQIIGLASGPSEAPVPAAPVAAQIEDEPVAEAAAQAKPAPEPEPEPAPKAEAKPAPEPEPEPEPAPKAEAKAEAKTDDGGDDFLSELDSLLDGDFDD